MMVNAYPNDFDDARSGRPIPSPLPSFSHLYAGFYPHRRDFHPTPEASTGFRLFSPALANAGGAVRLEGSSGRYNELGVHHTQPTHLRRSEVDGER